MISDNGGEVDLNEFRDHSENVSITVKTTPAFLPGVMVYVRRITTCWQKLC